jgi:hypothetical protein
VIVNRCICKIIARDLSLMVSRLYRMAVTRPQSRVAVTHGCERACKMLAASGMELNMLLDSRRGRLFLLGIYLRFDGGSRLRH